MLLDNFHMCFKFLHFSGVRPLRKNIAPLVIFNWIVSCFIISLSIINFVKHAEAEYFESVITVFQVIVKFGTVTIYGKEINRALIDVKQFFDINFRDKQNTALARYFSLQTAYVIYLLLTCVSMTLRPVILNGRGIFDAYVPEGVPFLAIYALEIYTLCVGLSAYVGLNILTCMLILLAVGQFRILNGKLKELALEQIKNEEELEVCIGKLKECVNYHNFLLTHIKRINDMVSMPITILLGFDITLLCLSMITLSADIPVVQKLQATGVSVALVCEFFLLYGLPAQYLMDETEAIGDNLYYYCNWHLPDIIPVRKYMLKMMMRSQHPTTLSAEGFIDVNKRTVLFMLKTAYTFFTFLRTV